MNVECRDLTPFVFRAEQNAMKMNDKKLLSLVKSAIVDLEKNKK